MCRRSLHFVEQTSQMRGHHHSKLGRRGCSHPAGFVERGDHSIKRIVLAKEENIVLATKVVVEIRRREKRCRGDIAHAGFREPAHAEFPACGAQDLQPAQKIASLEAAITLTVDDHVRQWASPRPVAAAARSIVSTFKSLMSTRSERLFRNRTAVQETSRRSTAHVSREG